MSTLPLVTFRDLLTQFAVSVDRAYDPLQSIDELADQTNAKFKFASWANTAMDRIWRPTNAAFAWTWTTASKSITLDSDSKFLWSDIDNSDWFNVWSQDPRPVNNPPNGYGWFLGNPAYPVQCVEDVEGLWPRIAQGTVYVFYRTARPIFSSRVVDGTKTDYAINTVVYDESATGYCYKALVNNAHGNALSDTSQWAVQAPPERVANVIAEMVETMRLQATGSDQSSKINQMDADTWMDTEMSRELPRDGSGAPWQYNRWHAIYRSFFIP